MDTNLTIKLDRSSILRLMGQKDFLSKAVDSNILSRVEEFRKKALIILRPQGIYQECKVVDLIDNNDFIIKEDLQAFQAVVVVLVTLGNTFDNLKDRLNIEIINSSILDQMILEAIGNVALMEASNLLVSLIKNYYHSHGQDISGRWAPGNGQWPLSIQKVIFDILDVKTIGVSLNNHQIMQPNKSVTNVYGIGNNHSNCKIVQDDCNLCNCSSCDFRTFR